MESKTNHANDSSSGLNMPTKPPTKAARQKHFSKILNEAIVGKTIVEHHDDLLALLSEHPAAEDKIGCGVASFKVDLVPPYFGKGFFIFRTDGSSDDFSYRICLNGRPTAKQRAKRAFRNEIFPQIDSFKSAIFSQAMVKCALTGVGITIKQAEIDHEPPNTFSAMMENFLSEKGIFQQDIETETFDGGVTFCIVDRSLCIDWQAYHLANARLRALSAVGHKISHANDNRSKSRRAA